jgi:hypothetical protein
LAYFYQCIWSAAAARYLPRNTGWYRKHFILPADWTGKSVWLYIEGSFHTTTSYLNGIQIGFHQAVGRLFVCVPLVVFVWFGRLFVCVPLVVFVWFACLF